MMEIGSTGLAQLPCFSIYEQQAFALGLGHGDEILQKLSKSDGDRMLSQGGDC